MATITRRTFLQGASVGAAAVGAVALGHGIAADHSSTVTSASRGSAAAPGASGSANRALTQTAASEPVMAYVRDATKGEVVIFVGTREIVRRDPDLAARLMHAVA
jgi:hypothetical protein